MKTLKYPYQIQCLNYDIFIFQESCIFVDNASQIINGIGKCINTFHDQTEFQKAWKELTAAHCPYQNDKLMSKQHHFKVCLHLFVFVSYHLWTISAWQDGIIYLHPCSAWRLQLLDCYFSLVFSVMKLSFMAHLTWLILLDKCFTSFQSITLHLIHNILFLPPCLDYCRIFS